MHRMLMHASVDQCSFNSSMASAEQLLSMQRCLVLTTALLMTGCVVYGSPSDQDNQLWSDRHDPPPSWTDCVSDVVIYVAVV